jgi:light-regulated signal transduction histidine kinase (bacteriophytochrome)
MTSAIPICELCEQWIMPHQIEQQGFTLEEDRSGSGVESGPRGVAGRWSILNNNTYSQDQKYVGVNLYRDNGSVKLEVVDHGIGIPPQEQQKIFEKFYRVGDPLVHNTKGSGLGLSLVHHIVHAHGGDVQVESVPGRGSKFTISIPVQPSHDGMAAIA